MSSRTTLLAGAIVHGLFVFLGTAGLGFVVLPAVARATSLDTNAEAFFSLLTLKAGPVLVGVGGVGRPPSDRGRTATGGRSLLRWFTRGRS